MSDLQNKYGLLAKDAELLKTGGNLRTIEKINKPFKLDIKSLQVGASGQGKIFSSQDGRAKTGSNIVSFPQTAIGLIIVSFKSGRKERGSGAFVGPNQILTAAHILYKRDSKDDKDNQIESIDFYPAICGQHLNYENQKILKAVVSKEYKEKSNPKPSDSDFGLIFCENSIGLSVGWFGMVRLPDESQKMEKIEVVGYPCLTDGFIQYSHKGKADSLEENLFYYSLDATEGQNGGPILLERLISETQSEYYIVGIHLGYNEKLGKNQGLRFSTKNFQQIKEIMEFHFHLKSLDEHFFTRLVSDQKEITFTFENSLATSKQMQDFCYSLKSNLEILELNLKFKTKVDEAVFGPEILTELGQSLNLLRKIHTLRLDFFKSELLTDDSFKDLGTGISTLKDLKILSINLNENQKITNIGINNLASGFQELPIEQLSIFIYNFPNIQDDALKYIGASIGRLSHINSLKLDLQMIKKCTEKGVKDMCQSMAKLPLQKFTLTIMGFKINDVTKSNIRQLFKNVKNFQFI